MAHHLGYGKITMRTDEGQVSMETYEGEDRAGGLEDRVRIRFEGRHPYQWLTAEQLVGKAFELYDGPISECDFGSIRTNTNEEER